MTSCASVMALNGSEVLFPGSFAYLSNVLFNDREIAEAYPARLTATEAIQPVPMPSNIETKAATPWQNPAFLAELIRQSRDVAVCGPHIPSMTGVPIGWDDLMRQAMAERGTGNAASPPTLPKGTRRDVPAHGFTAHVAVPGPFSTMFPGEACTFVSGRSMQVMGTDPELGSLLRYEVNETAKGSADDWTVACPKATMAFVDAADIASWPALGHAMVLLRAEGEKTNVVALRIIHPTADTKRLKS